MILDPGHFHAALVLKEMVPEVHPRVFVYAPLGEGLLGQLQHVVGFNTRTANPTQWELDVRSGSQFLERFQREQPGHLTVIAGRNRPKIDLILAAVSNASPVLVDKPWIVRAEDFDKLLEVQRQCDLRDLLAYDMMTERHEVTHQLLRDLIKDQDIFGPLLAGTRDNPTLCLESTHYLKKEVAGVPLRRPTWWFDIDEAGPGLADVGTHLVDLSMWLLFPDQALDYRNAAHVYDANIWPTPLSREQFSTLTGERDYPAHLKEKSVSGELLLYPGNGAMSYTLRDIHARVTVSWDYEAPQGKGDSTVIVAKGLRSHCAVRSVPNSQGEHQAELFVSATVPGEHAALFAAIRRRCLIWQSKYTGISAIDMGHEIQITIPERYRLQHEQHFTALFEQCLRFLRNPRWLPAWEWPNLLTRYAITTNAVRIAQRKQATG